MSDAPGPWPDSRGEWWMLAAITLVAAAARLLYLGLDSFWLDEAASAWFAAQPLADQWGTVPFYEPHPPLYYTLLAGWSAMFGDGEAALRGLSALAGTLTVPVVYAFARMVAGGTATRRIAVLAALLAAFHPVQILYAQEARVYALLTLSVAVLLPAVLWCLQRPRLLDRPFARLRADRDSGVRPALVTIVLATAAAFWFHNAAVLLVGVLLVVAAGLLLRQTGIPGRVVGNLAVAGGAILVLWLPNLRWITSGLSEMTSGFWIPRPGRWDFLYAGDQLFGSANIATDPRVMLAFTLCGLVLVTLGAAALWRLGRRTETLWLGGVLVVPIVVAVVTSYILTPIFLSRVFNWVQLPAFVLAAASLLWLRSGKLRAVVSAGMVAFFAGLILAGEGRPLKEPWRDVAALLEGETGPDDLIVLDTAYAQVPMLYYRLADRTAARVLPLPDAFPLPTGPRGYPNGFFLRDRIDAVTLEQVRMHAAASRTVWHVTRGHTTYDPEQRIPALLRSLRPQVTVRVTNGEAVLLAQYEGEGDRG